MEAELQSKLDNYEATHDYDEYHFDFDEIGHDPYVLISALTALKGGAWTLDEVQSELQMLFDKQYILTETVETEIRYRLETSYDEDGDPYTVQVPYEYMICTVTLENFDLSHVPVYVMSEDQLALYASYMATLGNRPDLFGDSDYVNRYYGNGSGGSYDIPPEALEDEAFAPSSKKQKNILVSRMSGAAAPRRPRLTVPVLSATFTPTAALAGASADSAPRASDRSARMYLRQTQNPAI